MIGRVHDKLQTNLNSIQPNNFNITTSNCCMFFDSPRAKILKFIGSENPTIGVKEFEIIVILVDGRYLGTVPCKITKVAVVKLFVC